MTRREEAERVYERARDLPPEARLAFVESSCREDPELRQDVLSLLKHAHEAEAFFEDLAGTISSTFRENPPVPSMPELRPGHTVRHYRIVERIGAGGMGTVYCARDTRLDREVALKFLPGHVSASDDAGKRLLLEAKTAAALDHPNVCTVHEIGETDDGRPFIAMALYGGETLKDRLDRGTLREEEAVDIAVQIARGLAAAHAHGIVHRDVKPGNVMLTTGGTVKLLDFGLARLADSTFTRPGVTPGTVAYMSPEQVRGDPLDRRTDLWSLGVVLYEMLTGVRPFRGGNDRALIQAILQEEPELLTTGRPEVPAYLERIVERLVRKDRRERYGDARELLVDLDRGGGPAGRKRLTLALTRRPALLASMIAALMSLAVVTVWLAGRGEESAPAATVQSAEKPSIAVLPLANLSTDPGDAVLADGMTQEVIAILGRNQELKVIASTSVFAFRNTSADVRTIADSLRVSNVLEGALQRIGSRLRVQVRLVDASDGSTRWSETYDRELQDLFSIQEDIARAVAGELDVRLTGDPTTRLSRRHTPNVAAYEFYLRGSDQALMRSDSGPRKGVEYFKQAIAADSMYAAAYAGLARMYVRLSMNPDPGMPVHELHALAEQAALKAVALDDSLAEARATLGLLRGRLRNDLTTAESELKRAIALDPTQAFPHQWLGGLYLRTGRPAEALAETRRALEIDPLSPSAHAEVAHALMANGRYDEALARLESIAKVQPPLLRVPAYTAQAYAGKGMWAEALAALNGSTDIHPTHDPLYGHLLARAGRREQALEVREILLDQVQTGTRGAFDMVVIEAGLENFDEAFAWLERSIEDRSIEDSSIMEPIFNELRRDPRFERIRPRLGIQNR
jgi:eukaryotic-like serine/threonine-protein kinase